MHLKNLFRHSSQHLPVAPIRNFAHSTSFISSSPHPLPLRCPGTEAAPMPGSFQASDAFRKTPLLQPGPWFNPGRANPRTRAHRDTEASQGQMASFRQKPAKNIQKLSCKFSQEGESCTRSHQRPGEDSGRQAALTAAVSHLAENILSVPLHNYTCHVF